MLPNPSLNADVRMRGFAAAAVRRQMSGGRGEPGVAGVAGRDQPQHSGLASAQPGLGLRDADAD